MKGMSATEAGYSWVNGRFSMRSGCYAGRPPSPSDLDSKILEMFYKGLKRDVGVTEANNFVLFVNNLTDLSATSFIVAFERFWASSCQNCCVRQTPGDRMQVSGYGATRDAEAILALAGMLGSPVRDANIRAVSNDIKRDFIEAHFKEIPEVAR